MKPLVRNTLTAIVVIGLGAWAIAYFASADIPRAFFEARIQAAGTANNLAVLINNSLDNLQQIEHFEETDGNDQALSLLTFEIEQKQEKQNAAALLASSLEIMARSATTINSGSARGLAIEAVTSGVSMVSRIVNYNNSMDQLFAAIQTKIVSGNAPPNVNIRSLLASINSDARAINELNNAFNATLKQFDEQYGTSTTESS